MRSEDGQAAVEWMGVVLVVALALAAAAAFVPAIDGRPFGSWLARTILCAFGDGCQSGDDQLREAYGAADVELLRQFAPNIVYEPGTHTLPVDFRRCRSHRCSDAPDDQSLEVTRSTRTRTPAAAFTHVVHRNGETFLQYWFYYPDSNSVFPGSRQLWDVATGPAGRGRYPGFHLDDWEGYQVRLGPSGDALVRASSHRGYQGCKEVQCHNRWIGWTGWTRVSKGSHAGHIPYDSQWDVQRTPRGLPIRRLTGYRPLYPGRDLHERTTSAAALELIPIETLPATALATDFGEVSPPWRKEVYLEPLSDSTS